MNLLILSIILLLLLANTITQYQFVTKNTAESRNNRIRVRTWWLICTICIAVFYSGGWVVTAFVYTLTCWAAFEVSKLLNLQLNSIIILAFISALTGYHAITAAFPEYQFIYFSLPFLILLFSVLTQTLYSSKRLKTPLLLVLCITSIFSIQLIMHKSNPIAFDSTLIILYLFFISAANDIFQYISGKTLGRTALAPGLSPNKTIEGAIGGIVLTVIFNIIALPYIISVSWISAALIGAFIAILGIIGDLHISYLKRQANVKDSGTSLPGHGGLLDRIDSLILTAPGFGLSLTLLPININT
ncbi:Phosphatidate cytidylyltransferase [hydrothermal vent metagenome]|uniref:Phosphatidate cytidylyltransferase n=1 Tax=hydrothermal vent metagenome TaxID=652676 RepID=A0A3B0XQD2_9ZZZZ